MPVGLNESKKTRKTRSHWVVFYLASVKFDEPMAGFEIVGRSHTAIIHQYLISIL
jgi:hypothetical protein